MGAPKIAAAKYVTVQLPGSVHKFLREIAKDREITLESLIRKLLEWASEKSPQDLLGLGVRLPVWPDDK